MDNGWTHLPRGFVPGKDLTSLSIWQRLSYNSQAGVTTGHSNSCVIQFVQHLHNGKQASMGSVMRGTCLKDLCCRKVIT